MKLPTGNHSHRHQQNNRNQIEEVKDLIFIELKSIIDDIKHEEELARYDEEEIM